MGKHRIIKPGDIFDNLRVVENLGYRQYCGQTCTYWRCECLKCGNLIDVPQKNLGKAQKDCGCGRKEPRNPIPPGAQFGMLTVLEIGPIENHNYTYLCECSCEKHTRLYVRGDYLRRGEVKSCGCLHDELFQKHSDKGKSTHLYKTHISVLSSKIQKNNTSGAKGVSWHKATNKWAARIQFQEITYSLGYYNDIEEAKEARSIAEKHLYKDFIEWFSKNYPDRWEKIKNQSESQG